jgi:anti-repressor protein
MKENSVQLFENNDFGNIRIVNKGNEPWFVLKDVCDILGLGQVAGVTRRINDDVISSHIIPDTLGRDQTMSVVNEDGLYDCIFDSRKPIAKAFRKWVTSEVLPSIRKTGGYRLASYQLEDPIERAKAWIKEQEEKKLLEATLEKDKPYTEFAKSIATSSDTISIGDFSKLLQNDGVNIGRNRLFKLLREQGFLIKNGRSKNIPRQEYIDRGYFEVKESVAETVLGNITTTTTLVTGSGQLFLISKVKELLRA